MAELQEINVSNAFSRQSGHFDAITNGNPLEVLYRSIIRQQVMSMASPGQWMLELNCGTGLDAIYFSEQGLRLLATDNADGMLEQLQHKIEQQQLGENIQIRKCSFNHLSSLDTTQRFHHIFSNYGGLNCAEDLRAVIRQMDAFLLPGGIAHLVFMAPVCPWEMMTAFKGHWKFAFRRLKKGAVRSHLEGYYFDSYYYSPGFVQKAFGAHYKTLQLRGIGSFMPPTYNEHVPGKYPRSFAVLKNLESAFSTRWPFNRMGDLFIISIQKKNA